MTEAERNETAEPGENSTNMRTKNSLFDDHAAKTVVMHPDGPKRRMVSHLHRCSEASNSHYQTILLLILALLHHRRPARLLLTGPN
tara:strand:+ start:480 stop:737 length:258 start_codon:yes stop_codon:yes gene_type:complete